MFFNIFLMMLLPERVLFTPTKTPEMVLDNLFQMVLTLMELSFFVPSGCFRLFSSSTISP